MASASDVPAVYDVVLNGQGFVFLDTITPNLPFRTHKATYKVSPTFIERSNVTGAFGDNQQDWWLTASQNDWSLGEEQKFFRIGDQVSHSRYWRGMNVDLAIPGQVTIARSNLAVTLPSPVTSVVYCRVLNQYQAIGAADVFFLNPDTGSVAATVPHSLGTTPTGVAQDGDYLYLSSESATKVQLISTGFASFTFSSVSCASSLAYLNNTLYGVKSGQLLRYDGSGNVTVINSFKTADGSLKITTMPLIPHGGRLMMLRSNQTPAGGPELWVYDGNATSQLLVMEPNFVFHDWTVSQGVLFMTGFTQRQGQVRMELRYYANGSTGLAYASQITNTSSVPTGMTTVSAFGTGVLFTDPVYGALMYFDLAAGSAATTAAFTASASNSKIASSTSTALLTQGKKTTTLYFGSDTNSAASLQTSLFDFESSLDKLVRSAKLDFTAGTDGNGGSVDLFYTTNDVSNSMTLIASGVTSGTDYPINVNCRSISLLVGLNKGTSTSGPILKRIYVRAAPVLQQFKQREYVFDCSGDGQSVVRELRDGSPMTVSGGSQASSLNSLALRTTPFSITDRFGTYTGLVDLNDPEGLEIYEVHSSVESVGQSGSFVVRLKCREV